jgi:SagB-type dehydrogenase family enzyme
MTTQRPRMRWPAGMRIRPAVDIDSGRVEATDTVTGRRFMWTAEALARYILADGQPAGPEAGAGGPWREFLAAPGDRGALMDGWRHWQTRRWYPSDQYYVASRRWDYVDGTDRDGSIRAAAVENFLRSDGPPAEEQRRPGPRTALGDPAPPSPASISTMLVTRRSGRAYVPEPVSLRQLSGLLWYGLERVRARRRATSPASPLSYLDSYGSAWDFYLCVYNVAGIEPGVYRYEVLDHELTAVRPGQHRTAMIDILQGMHSPATAAWTLGLVADFPRYQWRYRHEHGLRRLYIESGMVSQELIILGMSYGLSTLVTPAQKDGAYLALHELSPDRFAPVYTLTMGLSRGVTGSYFNDETIAQATAAAP